MVKLISAMAAIVMATSTLASAAPRQGAVGKTRRPAHAKAAKPAQPAKRSVAKARYHTPTAVGTTTAVPKTTAVRKAAVNAEKRDVEAAIVKERTHDLGAEEREIKRLKTNLKAAEKAGDWRRAARDRRVMYQLEADVRADKADNKDQRRANTKKSRIPFWGWWR